MTVRAIVFTHVGMRQFVPFVWSPWVVPTLVMRPRSHLDWAKIFVFLLTLQFFKFMECHLGFKPVVDKFGPSFRVIPFRKVFKSMTTFFFQFRKQKESKTTCLLGTGLDLDFWDVSWFGRAHITISWASDACPYHRMMKQISSSWWISSLSKMK